MVMGWTCASARPAALGFDRARFDHAPPCTSPGFTCTIPVAPPCWPAPSPAGRFRQIGVIVMSTHKRRSRCEESCDCTLVTCIGAIILTTSLLSGGNPPSPTCAEVPPIAQLYGSAARPPVLPPWASSLRRPTSPIIFGPSSRSRRPCVRRARRDHTDCCDPRCRSPPGGRH